MIVNLLMYQLEFHQTYKHSLNYLQLFLKNTQKEDYQELDNFYQMDLEEVMNG